MTRFLFTIVLFIVLILPVFVYGQDVKDEYEAIYTGKIENPNAKLYGLFGIFDVAAPNKWVPTIPFNFKVGYQF